MSMETLPALRPARAPWNKERVIGQKRPLLPKHVWSIRVRLEMADNRRDLARFNMAVTSQTPGLRSGLPEGERRLRRKPYQGTCFGHAEQDAQACPIRDHRGHAPVPGAMDQGP